MIAGWFMRPSASQIKIFELERKLDAEERITADLRKRVEELDAEVNARLLRCTFCDKDEKSVEKLFRSRHVLICSECVERCHRIIVEGMPT